MNLKNIFYAFACLAFAVVIGAAIYEHLCVVPQWITAPPHSLSMFQGVYGLNPEAFWIPVHPVTLLLLFFTLVLFWKTSRKKNILIVLIGYVSILTITAIYFVPELLEITKTPYSGHVDMGLTVRAKLWELLSLVRLVTLIMLAIVFFLGLTKSDH
ncbi:hypothetical protein ACFSKN_09985 [Mariniflexile gromovii]|uniref:DUF1772 domain-containing protein n=1 Tax=Mariniflexile gromovii TaxID=362523 RepID=A0ABS4BZE7_9FLAO|nr:hypothetical protein [Mariniflexile gromovii]MBP0905442.1 hypothetical protein [Mariniflexile gromovii]